MSSKDFIYRLKNDAGYRTVTFAVVSLIFNLMFAFYNGALGIVNNSIWFTVACEYYLLLGSMRFAAIVSHKKGNERKELVSMLFTGIVLCFLSVILLAVLYIGMSHNVGNVYGVITMITIATYTFIKIGMAVYKAVKSRHDDTPIFKAIRTIRYAEVSVALLSMQQSMLSTFGTMETYKARYLNMFTGLAVCMFILLLGINLIRKERILWKNQKS